MSLFWDRALATLGIVRNAPPATKPGDVQMVRDTEDDVFRPYVVTKDKAWARLQTRGFYPDLTGEQGVVDRSYPWGHVRRYGARGDGSTNDFVALNDAMQSAVNSAAGEVILDGGTFAFGSSLAIPLGLKMTGAGAETILLFTGSGSALSRNGPADLGEDSNIILRDFTIQASTASCTYGLLLENTYHVLLEGLLILGTQGGLHRFSTAGLCLRSTSPGNLAAVEVIGCRILQCSGNGVNFEGTGGAGAGNVRFIGCRIQGCDGYGVYYDGAAAIEFHFFGGNVEGSALGQFRISNSAASSIIGVHIEGGGSVWTPVVFGNDGGIQRNLRICSCGISGDAVNTLVLVDILSAGASVGVTIEDNAFAGAVTADIQFGVVFGLRVRNNQHTTSKPALKKGSGWSSSQNVHLIDPQRGEWFFGGADGANQRSAPRFTRGLSIGQNTTAPNAVGNVITKHISATKTWDPGSCAAGAVVTTTVTVAGCVLGDTCLTPAFSLALGGLVWLGAEVSAADTITIYLYNPTGGAIDLGSGTVRAGYLSYTAAADDALPVDTNILVS